MLVTERPGRVRLVERDWSVRRDPVARVEVSARGEGGLLALGLDPDFRAGQRFGYLYVTTAGGMQVQRCRVADDAIRWRCARVCSSVAAERDHG
jgi:glucose/arabinose dehydrogenase